MNKELIEQFSKQAIDYAGGKPMPDLKDQGIFLQNLFGKFAELIVQECSEVARHTILIGSGVDPDKFTGTVTTVQQIKRHFGVEE